MSEPNLLLDLLEPLAAQGRRTPEAAGRFALGQPRPMPHGSRLPISLLQTGLWLASRLDAGVPKFNLALAFALSGRLEMAPLRAALAAVVRRHESLRTRFLEAGGETLQEILPPDPSLAQVPEIDLTALPRPLGELELSRLRRALARWPFDLEEAPLFRFAVARTGALEHALFLTVHHLVFDGGSERVFWDDLSAYYAAALAGAHDPLPEPALQLADFSLWQQDWLTPERLAPQIEAWRENLEGLPPLTLPPDRPRRSPFGWRGAVHCFHFSPALTASVRAAARREGATPFLVLLAGFAAVLSRHSGQEDFAISAPIPGRRFSSVERSIGIFSGEVPLRVDLTPRPSALALVEQLRGTLLAALDRQDLPLDTLLRELGQSDARQRGRLFDIGFQVAGEAYPPPSFPGVAATPIRTHTGTAKLELEVEIEDRGPCLQGRCEFPLDFFDRATVARIFDHFAVLLEAALAEPGRPLADLDLLAAPERAELLAWSRPPFPPASELLLHQLVQLAGTRSPLAVAVESSAESWTYGELLARSGALARELRGLGAGAESLVAVCADRSPSQVAAFLAILETGAAYLPLDSGLPAERRALLLEDAAPAFLVAQESLLPSFGSGVRAAARPLAAGLAAVRIDGRSPAGGGPGEPTPESLAYVLYTSGSLGKPKAVGVPHRAVVNRLLRLIETFAITPGDAMLHKAHAAFDVAVGEIFAPLAAGARLVLAEPEMESDADSLAALIAGRGVTLADFIPALLEALLPHPPFAAAVAGLRQLFVGAEALSLALRDRLTEDLGVPVANMYGPTEATIDATWGCFAPGAKMPFAGRGETVGGAPIGRPFAGCAAYVLAGSPDSRLQPVGVAGELYLGGLCLARGYLGRPDLTAERFVPDPFSTLGGERLYRTGDRCRWREDGQLEFLDRADRQVKVRGVRIEPAEIEAALRSHPGVRDAAVIARRPDGGAVRLFACVVAAGAGADPAELRAFLAARLPEVMIPADFLSLPAFPLGANGKIDRRALALLEPARPRCEAPAEPGSREDRPGLERVIARTFGEVLGHDPAAISGSDDFFALGGHSLLATRAIWGLLRELGVRLTLRDFFAAPTPAALAARLRERISLRSLAYWRHQLEEPPPALELPSDRPRPPALSGERRARAIQLAAPLAAELRYLAQRESVSPEVLLLAAFAALLARAGGQDDLLIALIPSAAAGETLPFRARLAGDPSFLDLLGVSRETVLAALAHRDVPLELLAAELGLAGEARMALTRVAFAPLALAAGEPPAAPAACADFDLALRVESDGSGVPITAGEPGSIGAAIRVELSAAAELYGGAALVSLLERFERLLASAVASPVLPLSALPLLLPSERHQVLVEWRGEADARVSPGGGPFVHERVLAWALRNPEAPAVEQGDRVWTYGELARRAVVLARELRALGVGPESRVVVCLPRSPEWLLANLSVLLAGGAYVALDPALPADRLEWQLADSGATVLFAADGDFARRAAERGVRRLTPGFPPAEDPSDFAGFGLPRLAPGNLAYVIYTSGSTGKPKGVELTHGALAHLAEWQAGLFAATGADRCTVLAGVGFDASVLETWPYLAAGAALVIAPDEVRHSGEKLRDWLVAAGATLTFQAVPLAEELIGLDWPVDTALRVLSTGGDRLRLHPPATLPFGLVNLYGPTECTVISTFAPVRPAEGPVRTPPIGRPISGARAYVVDRDGELQAPGAPGELLLGGPGLARGYAGRPELTAASFVPDPFDPSEGREPGARLYRTGDLVRHLPSGAIEFLGRIDSQVKIRGFRIEQGETEATLVRHPQVRAASAEELASRLPLSFPQQRLWFLDRLSPGGTAYNIPLSYRLQGVVVPPALAAALGEIVRRHAVLRSRYVEVEGEPRQEIVPAATFPLPRVDLSALPAQPRGREIERLAVEERERPFDLGSAPLFRALLVAAEAEESVLLATVHHIAADGWSIAVLLDELEALYPAAAGASPSPLAEPRHQYADFALWQRAWPAEAHAAELAYWSGALAGVPTFLDLPADRPRPARPSFGGVTRGRGLGSRLSADLRRLARREGVTLYMLLLGVFEVLLARASGHEDFLVGSPVANRTWPELENLIGFFVNTLPLRARVPADLALGRLLRDVRETSLEAFTHQDLPFEELVDAFDPERDPSRNPLVQVLFALQTDGRAAGGEGGRKEARELLPARADGGSRLLLEPVALGEGTSAKFDLTLFAEEGETEIELTVEAATDLFEATTAVRFLEHYAVLLASAAASPEAPVAELEWLRPAERHQALVEWGDTRTFPRHGPWVHERVAAQARRSPGRPAVIHGLRQLSYYQLDRDATLLALRLRALGVAAESRVGVCLQRSPELIVAVLAVLKAGGAFVALDPAHPEERLRQQLEDAEVRVLLAIGPALTALAVGMGIEAIDPASLEPASIEPGAAKPALPAARLDAENLAYVIFTSGSTGKPKGVELTHGALLNLAVWQARALGAAPGDRTTVLAGVGFDASVLETWPYLAIGATLCIVPEEVRLSADLLQHWLLGSQISLSFLPVPLTEELLGLPWPERGALRGLSTGGDRLRLHPPEGLPFPLINLYGPTEGTVISTFGAVPAARAQGAERAPSIGRPIANALAYVTGREMEPRPIGFPGELLIGGEGLARGYLRRPDLTAASFLPDPLSRLPGARLYRTGDLVRLRADGTLDFLGRVDSQVKIRGYRIELGEIEATLARSPGVREAAVLLREGALAAFVAGDFPASERDVETELESALRRSLPDYMVPARFVILSSLPATSSDKIDRRALAALPLPPRGGLGAGGEPVQGTADPIADLIAGIWDEVLQLGTSAGGTAIGRNDNFFHLGGHSLLVTRVLSRLREALGVDLPVRTLFEAPTVAGLAKRVAEARRGEAGGEALPPLARAGRGQDEAEGERLPLSFPQQRLWFIDRLAPDSPTYNIGLAFALRGAVDWAALAGCVREAARRHQVLRTRFVEVDGQPWQEVLPAESCACPLIDLAALPEGRRAAEMHRAAALEAGQPFDLARGPVLRAALVRLASPGVEEPATSPQAQGHAFLLTVHHIASDGESNEILLRELAALYPAALAGRSSPLPEPPIQYSDYALWQRAWPPEVLDRQLAYWRRQLAGIATLEVATDGARPAVQSFRGEIESVRVPAPLLAQLRALAAARGVTPFMTLLAAWQALFHRLTGQTDVAVGSPVANRNRPAIEELVGFFINLLALRTDFAGDPGFGSLLTRVRRVALEAYDHADLPFERLVDELSPGRDLSRQPLVQVMFQLERLGPPLRRFGELELEPLELAGAVAKFDLTLSLLDRGSDLGGGIEYARDLFDRPTIARLSGQFVRLLAALAADPEAPLSRVPLLAPEERHQLLAEWNDTAAPALRGLLLHQPFEARAELEPHVLAAVCAGAAITYGELEIRANRLAHLLLANGLERGGAVGVWMDRTLDMLVAVLGILKAGGHYLPLEAAWPAERVETILGNTGAVAVLAEERRLADLEEMRWRLPRLADLVCLDVEGESPPPEPLDAGGVRDLFDYVAERATDRVTAGGFVSAFTGRPFTEAEVDEYRDHVLGLAAPWLRPGARVLEIGSGSGLLLWEMAARGAEVWGVDPSPVTQERNRLRRDERAAQEAGSGSIEPASMGSASMGSIQLLTGFAHEIDGLLPEGERFDLVLLASTVQFFPGPRYLEEVLARAFARVAPGGALLIADVLDARRKGELRRAIEEHAGTGAASTTGGSGRELYLDEDQLRGLGAALPGAAEPEILHRESGFANELGYRYDVVLRRESEEPNLQRAARRGRISTAWHAARADGSRPAAVALPDDLAYIIHTSGSTGEPKGIAVQHRPAVQLVDWINRTFEVGAEDRGLFVTSLGFDLSVYDVFGILAAGGVVHVATAAELDDPDRLIALLRTGGITLWDSAPAALVRLAPLFPAEADFASRLRLVMLSGDWIPVTLPDRVRGSFPAARVMALGGATEATVWSNWFPVGEVDPAWPSIPYGRPIANARYHCLDAGYQPCPVGVPGDLYIGGDCLCVGYARRPDLTAAAFVPDPFCERPGDRLYRTGDRVRYRTDGNLEFLGRRDSQVKIRGYRIELGEIEIALARLPGVAEAVVLAREDAPGDKRLVAYVVAKKECAEPRLLGTELRDALRRRLPAYMVPAAFVVLEHLPVTANGKLDRKALPAPAREGAAAEGEAGAPRTPLEERLALLWTEVLGVAEIGAHDNFFELGGHSLLATQLVARMRQTFGVDVPLHALFQRPTLADLAAEVEAATPEAAASPVRRIARDGELPLSYSQLRQWFLVQMEPEAPLYNLPLTLRLRGRLSRPALVRALAEIARRQESLRTRFAVVDGKPRPEIEERLEIALPVVDLAALAEPARRDESLRLVQDQGLHPFDLTRLPLLQLALLELAPEEHLLLFTVHHILFDGWSLGVFTHELADLYAAYAEGRPSPLPELAVQYVDYAAWQQEWMGSAEARRQIDYWRGRLEGSTELLPLPTDRPRPAMQTFVGAFEPIVLPAGLATALRALGRAEGATLYMTLLAGFAALLQRVTRQPDFNVGTWVANRRWREVEPVLGLFVNTLVLRADLNGGPSFRRLLARIKETTVGAFEHQDLPFETLLDELGTERNLSHTPLFQTLFGLQNFSSPRLELPGMEIEPLNLYEGGRANFDLGLWLWEEGDEITGLMQVNVDLFDRVTVRRWLRQLTGLFQAAAAEPGRRLAELPLLSAGERHQVVHEWADWEWVRDGAPPRPALRPVSALVAEQARRHPGKLAVEQEGAGPLTYAELEARSDALARRLRALGAGPERVVGLCSVRCPEMVVALLAIQKAGAAYLPLDPSLPAERMAFLLADAGAVAIVVSRHLPNPLPELTVPLLILDPQELARDAEKDDPDGSLEAPPLPGADLDGLAYVLYTSGSTGRPKGVLIDHGALARFVLDAIESYGFRASDRLLQFASLAFDNSAEEIYGTLVAGGTLVLRTEECLSTPRRFLAACRDWGITLLDLPTAYWHVLAGEAALGTLELPPALRIVILGGERVLPELIRAWLAAFGPYPRVWNTYGPTEATVMSAGWPLGRPGSEPVGAAPSIPIGRPLPSTRAWLLDPELQPVPVGVAGELHLAGKILARGYLGRPDLTAERFVPSPFSDAARPGERLYRSGDLVRYLPDGAIDFVGRVDDQVKIRGFRIEPGEIASVLGRHPSVRDAAVVALAGAGSKEWRLVAYLVANENETPAAAELRDYLKAHLPAYMVPADYVRVDAFPLTASGKLDRAALPHPEAQAAEAEHAPPETETEEILAGFWRDLLGRERVGIYDDFFDLGGHSLLAPQLMSSIAQTFEIELPLRVLFAAPTVAQLAVALEAAILAQIEGLDDGEVAAEWLEAG